MSELTLMILRVGFLLLLWFFIFAIVYALRSDLFGTPVRRLRGEDAGSSQGSSGPSVQVQTAQASPQAGTPQASPFPTASRSGPARQLVITDGKATGTSIPLEDDVITIGRSADSTLVIVDEYTSTYHARLSRSGDQWTLTDLDSTNGTKLAGSRVTTPTPLPTFTPVTIGTTTFELRP